MARDVFDIVFDTLIYELSDVTGIPSGHFWVNYPNKNFLNGDTYNKFPSVGIVEHEFFNLSNNYGDRYTIATESSGVYTEYTPAGEVKMRLQIDVFTKEPYQRREYKSLLNHYFQQTKLIETQGDILDGQHFSIVTKYGYQSMDEPYTLSYIVECGIQDFKEQEVYLVNEVVVNTQAGQGLDITDDINLNLANIFTATSGSPSFG